MLFLAADFETTKNDPSEVWLSGFMDIKDYKNINKIRIQTDIKMFFKELFTYIAKNIGKEEEAIVFSIT